MCSVHWTDQFAKVCNLFRLTYPVFGLWFFFRKACIPNLNHRSGGTEYKAQGSDLKKTYCLIVWKLQYTDPFLIPGLQYKCHFPHKGDSRHAPATVRFCPVHVKKRNHHLALAWQRPVTLLALGPPLADASTRKKEHTTAHLHQDLTYQYSLTWIWVFLWPINNRSHPRLLQPPRT